MARAVELLVLLVTCAHAFSFCDSCLHSLGHHQGHLGHHRAHPLAHPDRSVPRQALVGHGLPEIDDTDLTACEALGHHPHVVGVLLKEHRCFGAVDLTALEAVVVLYAVAAGLRAGLSLLEAGLSHLVVLRPLLARARHLAAAWWRVAKPGLPGALVLPRALNVGVERQASALRQPLHLRQRLPPVASLHLTLPQLHWNRLCHR